MLKLFSSKMAVSFTAGLISGLKNARNVVRSIGNHANIASHSNHPSFVITRKYSAEVDAVIGFDEVKPKKKISKAMKAYLERSKEYDEFMKKEVMEYEIGKRHLANMMGENPETFTQDDVNRSIEYLFPSSLYDPKARPIMESPDKIFPPKKAAQFDISGRPFHPLFYTCKPNYYQLLHDIVKNTINLIKVENEALRKGLVPHPENKINLLGSEWMCINTLKGRLLEEIVDSEYEKFVAAADRLVEHPYAFTIKDYIMTLRHKMVSHTENIIIPELQYTPEGRPYTTAIDSKRKSAMAKVTVFGNGTGKITINNQDIRYFHNRQSRDQVRVFSP